MDNYDRQIEMARKQIANLEIKKAERSLRMQDPKYVEVRDLYVMLAGAINKLNELGEHLEDGEGYDISIEGASFRFVNGELRENN